MRAWGRVSICIAPFFGWVALAACGSSDAAAPSGDAGADAHVSKTDSGSTSDSGAGAFDSDPQNCGAASHDCAVCGGSTCTAGQCVPAILASAQSQPYALAVDSTKVYWTNLGTSSDGSVASVNLDGSNLKVLAPPPVLTSGIALDATRVFFASVDPMHVGKDGTGLITVGPAPGLDEIAVDDTRVYRAEARAQEKSRLPTRMAMAASSLMSSPISRKILPELRSTRPISIGSMAMARCGRRPRLQRISRRRTWSINPPHPTLAQRRMIKSS